MSESESDSEFWDLERGDSEGKLLGGAKHSAGYRNVPNAQKGVWDYLRADLERFWLAESQCV